MKVLRPHQIQCLKYAVPRKEIALFMEMRLGKTLVGIRWAKKWDLRNSVLTLAPKPVLPPWESELQGENISSIIPAGKLEKRYDQAEEFLSKGWVLMNYEAITLCPAILDLPWKGLICDESTYIRNPRPNITKFLIRRTSHIRFRAILSGLPDPESTTDFVCQFIFLNGEFMGHTSYWNWRHRYCYPCGFGWEVKKKSIPLIKQAVEKRAFVLTRKEVNIGSEKIYEQRFVETNSKQRKLATQISKDYEYQFREDKWITKYAPVMYMALSRISGGFTPNDSLVSDKKIKEVKNLLASELKGQRVVIWFRFNHELKQVRKELKKKWNVGIFTASEKYGTNKDMTLSKDIDVMCAQAKLGQRGLPWYDSSVMIFYSNYYDYEVRAQCEDRGIHPLKKEPYLIIDLISENTIDEEVIKILKSKKKSGFMEQLDNAWRLRNEKNNNRPRSKRNRVRNLG